MSKILRRRQVEEVTGLSSRTIDRREAAGDFPKRVVLGANSVGWRADEVYEWVNSRARAGEQHAQNT